MSVDGRLSLALYFSGGLSILDVSSLDLSFCHGAQFNLGVKAGTRKLEVEREE
jgi:hypothetical protein